MSDPRTPAGGAGVRVSVSERLDWTQDTAGAFPSNACLPGLNRHWTRELVERSAIDPTVITERGYQTVQWGVHPRNRDRIVDPTVELWTTEGIKKADALTGTPALVLAQPYHLSPTSLTDLTRLAQRPELHVVLPGPGWYGSGTTAIEIWEQLSDRGGSR